MNRFKLKIFSLQVILCFLCSYHASAQLSDPPFLKYMNHPWVDSVLNTLTIDQQIAQCIWVAGYSNKDVSHEVEMSDAIKKYGIGGIVFFQGKAEKQAELTNYYQKISVVPLIISMDAEWGIGMRLDNVEKFPYQMTLGAIKNDSIIYRMGSAIGSQFKRLGMQINFAPVADININPQNPVINYRSFGETKENVAAKCIMYMKGMQDAGILATIKHFPGHGDTDVDSHYDLPVIKHNKNRLDSIELYPFRKLISEGAGCIMTAHLNLPLIDTSKMLPASLSPVIINGILKTELGFRGLVISDAMNMKGVTKYFKPGEAEAKALEAGNDVIEYVADIEAAIRETKNYISMKKISADDIALKCRKILAVKYWSGLCRKNIIKKENIDSGLSPESSRALIYELYSDALTTLNNDQNIIPVKNLSGKKIATLSINKTEVTQYQKIIGQYNSADHFTVNPYDPVACNIILKKLTEYDLVIAGVYGLDQRPNTGFGLKSGIDEFIEKLNKNNKLIITWFGNPYSIDKVKSLSDVEGLLLAYQENTYAESIAAQIIFGGKGSIGTLPVTINKKWPSGYGIITPGNFRMQYGIPESAGMSSEILSRKVDSIVNAGLTAKAYPGCEVMVARKGIVVFHKCYGYQTYDNSIPVTEDNLFDIASITKITATLPALMFLNGQGKFSPDEKLVSYLPFFRHSDKENLVMREILAHQAGFTAWIPFWKNTVKKNRKYKHNVFRTGYSDKYSLEVANGLYLNRNYRKNIFREIKKEPLGEKKYLYSDLGFIIAPQIIEKLSGEEWTKFVSDNIYKKIGADDIVFNPLTKYPVYRIVPTEYDSVFRKQLIYGTVHDEGAAMQGGISGNAGVFTTANDLMKLMEMYRRNGEYGGEQLISGKVMDEYTRVQYPENNNRRGLGFDKPLINNNLLTQKEAYPTRGSSPSSFGHSGFTGTFVWIDPAYDISYIFLSNRVYPTRENNAIANMNIRTETLQAIYDSIIK
jgi:beta-N-acetylhexosaminidase